MDSRPSKVSPSTLSLRSQAVRQDASLLKMVPYDSKSPIISLANRPIGRVGVPENGFNTSRSRGRSAIYSMARTPYSRVCATNKVDLFLYFSIWNGSLLPEHQYLIHLYQLPG